LSSDVNYEKLSLGKAQQLARQGDPEAERMLRDLNTKVRDMVVTFAEGPRAIAAGFAGQQRERERQMQQTMNAIAAATEAKEKRRTRRDLVMVLTSVTSCVVAVAALVLHLMT
jgi:folylpolyglutamate synthase/dihydropteroate synthase